MAMINLTGIHFNDADDPSDHLRLDRTEGSSRITETPGEFRRGAGGRVRLIRRARQGKTWAFSFQYITKDEAQWLEDHAGKVVCARDPNGNKMFGSYLGVEITELPDRRANVSFEMTEVTVSEGV